VDFWKAYCVLREKHCVRPESVAVGVGVSFHTVLSWDRCAADPEHDASRTSHRRAPNHENRVRLAKLAKGAGASERVVDALMPVAENGARA
jgi:hypothetical protein